jgi:hypothetical protein
VQKLVAFFSQGSESPAISPSSQSCFLGITESITFI